MLKNSEIRKRCKKCQWNMNFLIIQTKQEPSPVKKTVPANTTVMYMIHFYSGIALAPRALKEYIKQHRQSERSRVWTNTIWITLCLFLAQQPRKQKDLGIPRRFMYLYWLLKIHSLVPITVPKEDQKKSRIKKLVEPLKFFNSKTFLGRELTLQNQKFYPG